MKSSKWVPDLAQFPGTRYQALANAIESGIKSAQLKPDERLPTHRFLADALGVTVGTVTRGYAEAESRGLVYAVVGRGTFVRPLGTAPSAPAEGLIHGLRIDEPSSDVIDLSLNLPVTADKAADLAQAMGNLAQHPAEMNRLLCYQPEVGMAQHRRSLADWFSRSDWEINPDDTIIVQGAQHGILVTLMALTRPGDILLTEGLTYPGLTAITQQMKLETKGLPMDAEGIVPEALEAACQKYSPRLLYCIPVLQNPTTVVMSPARRAQVIDICKKYQVMILEDDIYAQLLSQAPAPMASMAPEAVIYVSSVSKTLSPGLRVGLVVAPPLWRDRIAAAVRASCWMTSPISVALVCEWIHSGLAATQLQQQRDEMYRRHTLAREILGDASYDACIPGFHIWLKLPETWRAGEFVREAAQRKILLKAAGVFAVGHFDAPHAVRIALSGASDMPSLQTALETLRTMLDDGPSLALSVV
ncbi:MAG: PLP-dependent aminotransferase family protein [Hahellaceae bacterium]|nr:PLP-dependent aminotransferase family protein [Hahellaceae bacterium]MCP5169376.1 PLP-dependent aminotransferase family protein [Hahellaceae bacterium]